MLAITAAASTGTPSSSITVTAPAHTFLTKDIEYTDINFNLNRTVQYNTATSFPLQRAFRIQAPTYTFIAGATITTAVTAQIDSAPVAGSGATLTNAYALRVLTGTTTGVGIVIQGASSQSGDLFQIQNFGGTKLLYVDSNYSLYLARSLNLTPFNTSAGNTSELRFYELAANGTNYVGFKAGDSIASNVIWTLPTTDGTSGQFMSTNASGTLSWTSNAPTATAATNLSNGGAGQVPYNTASGATSFLSAGTSGFFLKSNNTSAPSWASAVTFTSAATAPVSPIAGDTWLDTTSGILYRYFYDGDTNQWVQF